ncbi:MAG: malonyl-ACP O-methyltransferase BioC [Burkholderiales bacterium]|nr:malonyl-ACP O-methyltransferase BioC [Burkholderiales bacterium]
MSTPPPTTQPDPQEIDARAVRRAFTRAAATYDAAAVLQREIGSRMAQRLDYVRLAPELVLDGGCGTGEAVVAFATRYPQARVVAMDLAWSMVTTTRARTRAGRGLWRRLLPAARAASGEPWCLCADLNALPLRALAFDLVWSNLALQWVNDVPRVFAEWRRVLKVGGLLSFSTFGPDTLREVREAFRRVDGHTHTSRFIDMHDLGDMLVGAGFADPVMDMETITMTYADPAALLRELKHIGATNATRGRPHGLMGRARWQRMLAALSELGRDGRIPATFEVVYGHAWKIEPTRTAEGHAIVKLTRRSKAS